ncbi:hypothetical protein [Reyranella sp.]|uniref:hypothetical protein n=1 Tax=Reyranella sp. TaxID=1929291 RepID=UPI003BAA046A
MAALSITATQVLLVSGSHQDAVFGAAVTAGQGVYFDSVSGSWKPGQCDGTAAEAGADGYGIALCSAAAGQRGGLALPGAKVNLGAAAGAAAGTVYALGATAGALNPSGDMSSGNRVTPLALGIGGNQVKILAGAYDPGAIVPA